MSKVVCNLITPQIEELAKGIGRTPALTCIMVNTWQTQNQTFEYPTIDQLREYSRTRHPQLNKDLLRINHSDDFARLMRDFTPFTLHDRATAIARTFSDIVSREVESKLAEVEDAINQEKAKETPNEKELSRLYAKRDEYSGPQARWAAIQDTTVKSIFDQIRGEYESYLDMSEEELDEIYGKGRGAYLIQEYTKILNNFPALLTEACIMLENTEHLRIISEYHDYNDGATTTEVFGGDVQESSDVTEVIDEQFSDDEDGTRTSGNDGWSFQVRFVDPYTTLSKGVKEVLSSIVRVDVNGNIDTDDLGNVRYLNPEYTHVAMLNSLSGIVDANDFSVRNSDGSYSFPALEKAMARYPWVSQIINALQANPTLVGSFYADLRKDFIPYWHQYVNEEGILVTHALNQNTALESTFNAAQVNYEERQILDPNSLYTRNGTIDSNSSQVGKSLAAQVLNLTRDFNEDDISTITYSVSKMLKMLGFDISSGAVSNLLQSTDGIQAVEKLVNSARNIFQEAAKVDSDSNLFELFGDDYRTIAEIIGIVGELDNIASFRQGDKTRYSYSTPNYIDTMIKIIKDDSRRQEYLDSEFGRFEWFKKNGRWRSGLLAALESDEDVRFYLSTKELIDINGTEYSNWRPNQIRQAFVNEYAAQGINIGSKKQFAWYNMPIFSDSPVVKFIRLPRYTGDFKAQILPMLRDVVKQELYRIDLVEKRRVNGAPQIQSFDKNGDKFHFFPELNKGDFLQRAKELIKKGDGRALSELIDTNVNSIMDALFQEFLANNAGLHAENLMKQGVIKDASQEAAFLEEYFWNQAYATTQIIELTTTDLAFYKDDVDFQKRYKEVYASGIKLNTNSAYGKPIRRTVYLADSIITSTTFQNIKSVLDKAVSDGLIQTFDRDNILDKFKDINVADAQAYVSPKAMRTVLDMMGAWTDAMEQSFERFERGEWDMSDFNTLWQTIKPFVYTQLSKPSGLNDGKMIKVPHQNKNSEYLLLAAYNVVASSLGASPQLRALQRFMSENDVDVVQFQSAVKAGGQGIVNVNYSQSKLEKALTDEILAAARRELGADFDKASDIDKFKAGNDYLLEHGHIGQEEYNNRFSAIEPSEQEVMQTLIDATMQNNEFRPEVVHEIPYRDYVIQQPTPEHLIDAEGVFGSQLRNLIMSDLPEDFSMTVNGVQLDKHGVFNLYQSLIVENLLENYQQLTQRFQDIRSLQRALMSQVKGNVKYSRDMVNALQIVKVINPFTGVEEEVFNMPLSNPSVTLKLQELINSMFKNGISKQYIKGGNAILVSSYGLTHELNLVYDGDRLAGIECYLPASSRKFYEPFMKSSRDGSYQYLDINKMPQELRRLVGYRIPTEDKYSMAPLIVKGFLPQQNGSAIMLPADITQLAGSDFDVDKMFLMIPEFSVQHYDKARARRDFAKQNQLFASIIKQFSGSKLAQEFLKEDTDDFKIWFAEHKEEYKYDTPKVRKVRYDINRTPQENNRIQRNNMLIDIIYGVLTNSSIAPNVLNPGNFDTVKLQARITKIITDPEMFATFCQTFGIKSKKSAINKLLYMSKKGELGTLDKFLKDYRKVRSQLTLETFIYNHVQNMTGAALIGMYANNTTAQAKYQYSLLALKDNFVFHINGRRIQSLHDIVSATGERISRNCAQFSAASVDNVKDPVLADLLQNVNTARVTGFMLRAGMSIEEISLLFAQPIVRECIQDTGSLDRLGQYINVHYDGLVNKGGSVNIHGELRDFSSEELMDNVISSYSYMRAGMDQAAENVLEASNIEAAMLMEHIVSLSNYVSELTQISRADSPNGAILNTLAGAKVQVAKVRRYNNMARGKNFPFVGISEAISNGVVNENMSIDQLRDALLRRKMPMLEAFYSLGIELGTKIVGKYFQQVNPYSDKMLATVLESAPLEFLSNQSQARAVRAVGSFYKDLVNFALSATRTFGDDVNLSVLGSSFINHSGGAIGSDSYWGTIGARYGVKSNHYYHGSKTPNGNIEITQEQFEEGKKHVLEANKTLNRRPDAYMDLLARNWIQVKNADAVFAIGHLKKGIVDGGTGWAVQMAIDSGKPVYVFDQERKQWYKNIDGEWSESEIPTLIQNFAGIGTRQLNEAGKSAIEDVYRNTFVSSKGMTFEEKRDYYLNEYPNEFLAAKARNPEIAKLGLFKKLVVKNGKIQLLRSGRMKQQARDSFMRDMDSLMYMGDEGIKMARDLFMYAYYSEGFWFGPNSFGNFFSTNFFNSFPEVMEALRYMKGNMQEGSVFDRFLPQYYANHYKEGIVPDVSNDEKTSDKDKVLEGSDGAIFVPASKAFNRTTNQGEYPYVVYKGQLYQLALEGGVGSRATYRPATTLNNPKYNANMTVDEMKEFDGEVQSTYSEDLMTEMDAMFEGMTADFSDLDASIDQGFDEYLAQMEQFSEQSGEETLKQPLCK